MKDTFKKFQLQLERLPSCCTVLPSPRLSLSREGCSRLACIGEESLPTRAACVREAEAKLRALYREAEQALENCGNPVSPDSFLAAFQAELSRRLLVLKELLGLLRTPGTAALVNRINACLSPDRVFEEMGRFNDTLRTQYVLEGCGKYFARIEYGMSDTSDCVEGAWKLVALAFRRYGYDLLPAIHALEEDGNGLLGNFRRAFDTRAALTVRAHIATPVLDKLPLLRMIPSRAENEERPAIKSQ